MHTRGRCSLNGERISILQMDLRVARATGGGGGGWSADDGMAWREQLKDTFVL